VSGSAFGIVPLASALLVAIGMTGAIVFWPAHVAVARAGDQRLDHIAARAGIGSILAHVAIVLAVCVGAAIAADRTPERPSIFSDAIDIMLAEPAPTPAMSPPAAPVAPPTPLPVRAPLSSAPSDIPAVPPPLPPPATPAVAPAQPALPSTAPAVAEQPSSSASTRPASANPKERDRYLTSLMAWLNRFKRYPTEARRERVEGVVVVRFTMAADGSVLSSNVLRSSGHATLDQAALEVFQRASPLPAPPASFARAPVTLTLPIEFSLQTR